MILFTFRLQALGEFSALFQSEMAPVWSKILLGPSPPLPITCQGRVFTQKRPISNAELEANAPFIQACLKFCEDNEIKPKIRRNLICVWVQIAVCSFSEGLLSALLF